MDKSGNKGACMAYVGTNTGDSHCGVCTMVISRCDCAPGRRLIAHGLPSHWILQGSSMTHIGLTPSSEAKDPPVWEKESSLGEDMT